MSGKLRKTHTDKNDPAKSREYWERLADAKHQEISDVQEKLDSRGKWIFKVVAIIGALGLLYDWWDTLWDFVSKLGG